jgi:hypothetical protein
MSMSTERRDRDQAREELARELGLDELTYEACVHELFAEFVSESAKPEPARVVQTGPGRRRTAERMTSAWG